MDVSNNGHICAAGRSVTEEKLDLMLESDDPQVFTHDVCVTTTVAKVVNFCSNSS